MLRRKIATDTALDSLQVNKLTVTVFIKIAIWVNLYLLIRFSKDIQGLDRARK
jgi:hypothetical protein